MRNSALALAIVGALAGCGSSTPTRTITGQLTAGSYSTNGAVVVAESSDARVFVAPLTQSGRFTLTLPSEVDYRLPLARGTATSGVYSAMARINWPLASGPARWAHVGAGDTLDLGHVYRRGTQPAATSGGRVGILCDACGGRDGGVGDDDHGECHEDDGAKCKSGGHEDDCDCDHKAGDDDHCDQDDDSGDHDKACDDHDDGDDDHGSDDDHGDDDGDHGGSHSCDGGASGGGGSGGSGGGAGPGGGSPDLGRIG